MRKSLLAEWEYEDEGIPRQTQLVLFYGKADFPACPLAPTRQNSQKAKCLFSLRFARYVSLEINANILLFNRVYQSSLHIIPCVLLALVCNLLPTFVCARRPFGHKLSVDKKVSRTKTTKRNAFKVKSTQQKNAIKKVRKRAKFKQTEKNRKSQFPSNCSEALWMGK